MRSITRFSDHTCRSLPRRCSSTPAQDLLLAHLVLSLARRLPVHIFRVELVRDLDVQITVVLLARPGVECTGYGLTLLDRKHILQIEHRLFPVRVLGVWACRKANRLMAGGKLDVEPGDDGVDEVAAADFEAKGAVEGEVFNSAGIEIEGEDGRGVGDDGFNVDGVDEGFGHGRFFERGVVETPDVVPD